MSRFFAFLKATLLGGVIVVLPAWLAVLLALKALGHLEIFVKPVSSHLPHSLAHPRVIAILVPIGLCFLVGAAIQTAIGQKAERAAERAVVEKIPGFVVERHSGDRCTAFIPSVPTPMAGAVYIIDNNRVHPLDLPAVSVMQCISKWGGGSDKLVAAYDAARVRATSLVKATN